MGVCPFSVDASRAGLPVGQVRYPVSREATAEAIYREYWREVCGGPVCALVNVEMVGCIDWFERGDRALNAPCFLVDGEERRTD